MTLPPTDSTGSQLSVTAVSTTEANCHLHRETFVTHRQWTSEGHCGHPGGSHIQQEAGERGSSLAGTHRLCYELCMCPERHRKPLKRLKSREDVVMS